MISVEHSGDQDRQRQCAEEDVKHASCHENGGVWLPKLLALLDKQVRVIFDLLHLEMSQVRIVHAEDTDILLGQLVRLNCNVYLLATG